MGKFTSNLREHFLEEAISFFMTVNEIIHLVSKTKGQGKTEIVDMGMRLWRHSMGYRLDFRSYWENRVVYSNSHLTLK